MRKQRGCALTIDLLDAYQDAALANARELLEEARLLLSEKHYARAYFLAMACIEETGKAYSAFDAKGRNLDDNAVCMKVRDKFEDRSSKLVSAFRAWSTSTDSSQEMLRIGVGLVSDIKDGRERSMYIDVAEDETRLSVPRDVVRPDAATDCVKLAALCLRHTESYVNKNVPPRRTFYEDRLLNIGTNALKSMVGKTDFWEYYVDQCNKGETDLYKAMVTYHDDYHEKKREFGDG
ncbi:MAG TPA: AbiV family abortive infection protein [Syntrophorhabdaceae bacterium]|nr:AbiV family abortive infection protein [Syntrophorhabdaceae bacterium]